MLHQLKVWFKRFKGKYPIDLPRGMKEFEAFASSIFQTYDIPDLPSYRNAIASMIMHLDPTASKASPAYFAVSIRKAQANQVAYEVIQELKKQEKEKQESEAKSADGTSSSGE